MRIKAEINGIWRELSFDELKRHVDSERESMRRNYYDEIQLDKSTAST